MKMILLAVVTEKMIQYTFAAIVIVVYVAEPVAATVVVRVLLSQIG